MSYENYTGLLMAFDDFPGHLYGTVQFSHDHTHPKLMELKEKYALRRVAGAGSGLVSALNMLHWLCSHTYHADDAAVGMPSNALDLLAHAFDKGPGCGLDSQGLAVSLTECLLAVGFEARTIYTLPFSHFDDDIHAVTSVYIWDMHKWAMLDPTYEGLVLDEADSILSPWEARKALAFQLPIHFNDELNYNGQKMTANSPWYTEFLAKNLFYFQTRELSTFSSDTQSSLITVAPRNFDIRRVCACMSRVQFKDRDEETKMSFRISATGEDIARQATLGRLARCPL